MSFCKKNFKVVQNQEQANERASQVKQAIHTIQESQEKLVSLPKTANSLFFEKIMLKKKPRKIKRNIVLPKKKG